MNLALLVSFGLAMPAAAQQITPLAAPEGAKVYIVSPANGETVSSPVIVRFGLKGMGVAPAGVENPKTGHHHLLVNKDLKDLDLKAPVPFTDETRHFGGGQTEASLELKPGTYTLQMLLADHRHISFNPPVTSEKITITVK
jgi:hypothetical protein